MSSVAAGVGQSTNESTAAAVAEAISAARSKLGDVDPALVFVTATVDHDAALVHQHVREKLPGAAIHGITTSLGVLGSGGVALGPKGAVGVLVMGSPDGTATFGVGSAAIEDDGAAAGAAAAEAMQAAMTSPASVVLFNASPGLEEDVLTGVGSTLPDVPAYGGSAADHTIEGLWSVFTNDGIASNAVSLAGIGGNVRVGASFLVPYDTVGDSATVTAASGRTLQTVSERPAAEVLGDWVGPGIADQVQHGGNILAQTALNPLGLQLDDSGKHFVTLHPAQVDADDGSVGLFAVAPTGSTVCRMRSTEDRLITSIGELMQQALDDGGMKPADVRAGVLIYCAGCAGALGAALHEGLREHLAGELADVPLLGLCTFGEQGYVPGTGNVHSNLSLSVVLLGDG